MMKRIAGLVAGSGLLAFAVLPPLEAQVIVEAKQGGGRIVGESMRPAAPGVYEVSVYRGFSKLIPAGAIASVMTNDLLRSADRAAFAARLAALKPRDTDGGIELAQWATERGLTVEARALLHRLRERDPGHRKLRALLDMPPAPVSLSDADRLRLERQTRLYFADPTNREPVLLALRGADAIPLRETERWAALAFESARAGPKAAVGDTTFRSGDLSCSVHIEMHGGRESGPAANAVADREERWPVLVALHGGGLNTGDWKDGGPRFLGLFRRHFDRLLFVAPTVMHKRYAEWGGNIDEERLFRELFKAVKRTWPVDTDRVYLAGVSMGGYGVWHIGGHEADTFAGLVSDAGGILIGAARGETWGWGAIGNLMHTPIAFVHGGKDEQAPPWSDAEADRILTELATANPGTYRHKYASYPSAGHSVPGEGTAKAVEWIAPFVRNPAPAKILWEPSRAFVRNFFWLHAAQPRMFTRLEAETADNTIKIRTGNLNGGFGVWVDPRLIDLEKPVTIMVDDRLVFRSFVRPALSAILESVDDKLDERMWYPARIDF